ncbi:HTH-type transcriptional regulator DmlR [Zhongshania aliphaticivorans]|uniref:HTH-type transcriptional regulator DmlR n=1 Tax=Zhongshania aliphaticivorans TaxID=1470434 RepID=A0A5S9QJP2_9GAMM|nr:LysR family transcriptional regulator [Zhongshania aliphaticivorans]CAA0111070.1 HTH-type transcriptional regulator DmlR [Zhongshania aliphaticivorans]CAA0118432.1 HTH-type transcriptional regulator DmlR [Zhongshania aliphaticivorans]CAA0122451.1 HTH-type transcriptional regulator DmlR [Zhongshania aliphaticivorans]
MDKLKAMYHLCCIAEVGSFSAAAKLAGVPVSTVSRSIQSLESELGAALLKRSTRHVALTEIGKIYLNECKDILAAIDRVEGRVGSYQNAPSGVLRISALPHYGEFRLLPLLEEFQQRYPKIVIDLELSSYAADLQRDGIDIAIRGGREPDGRVIAQRLEDNTHRLCASQSYINKFGMPHNLSELVRHRAILYRSPAQVLHWHVESQGGWRRIDIDTAQISNSLRVIRQGLLTDQGVAMLPSWSIEDDIADGRLCWIPIQETLSVIADQPVGSVYMLYQQPQYTIPKIKVAVDFFKNAFSGR